MDSMRAFKEEALEKEREREAKKAMEEKAEKEKVDSFTADAEGKQKRVRFADDVEMKDDSDDEKEEIDPKEIGKKVIEELGKDQDDGAGLLVPEDIRPEEVKFKEVTKMRRAQRWFSDRIFDEIETNDEMEKNQMIEELGPELVAGMQSEEIKEDAKNDGDDEESDGEFEVVPGPATERRKKRAEMKRKEEEKKGEKTNSAGFKYKDLPDILKLPYKVRRKMEKMNRDHRR